ncbi:hypothetical protein SAY87_007607 [Trapa incisa]|uniref:Uncharacterized protein n=1 Tax=Trapa incisa TaxID=236973 RepID=A0AAN7QIG5_9MYRT|nr:hypothetical protein SAY87_007607 [Trapa incisa]
MSRPWVLVFLLLLIVFTSQFEWKQQFRNEVEQGPNASQKERRISKKEEVVKEKIILSQEKNIQKLNELVRSLHEQLLQCRGETQVNGSSKPMTEILSELDRRLSLED